MSNLETPIERLRLASQWLQGEIPVLDIEPADVEALISDHDRLTANIESDAKVIAALKAALCTVKLYIANQMIANAVVVPIGEEPHDKFPTLMQVVDKAISEQTAGDTK